MVSINESNGLISLLQQSEPPVFDVRCYAVRFDSRRILVE